MKRSRLLVLMMALLMTLAVACVEDSGNEDGADDEAAANTGQVNVLNALSATEGDALQAVVDETLGDADYEVEIEASEEFEEQLQIRSEAGTLDMILLPQPGAVVDQAASGNALSLEDLGFDIAELEASFGEYFLSLGEYEGEHYGIPTNANYKSMIWYPKDDFDAAGYEVPTTWDDLLALSDQIVADGGKPWCVGFESGTATGWPATDWMEDIMLRTAGPETYDSWVAHEIPFDDPAVKAAAETFGEVMFADDYVLGGAENTPALAFTESPLPMFDNPPKCWLHRQANFIIGAAPFPKNTEAGVDYDWFPFPTIDQDGALFAGELAVVFSDRPEVVDFAERFMDEELQCAQGGDPNLGRISPNVNVGPDCYANPILADSAEVLTAAIESGTGRFDASDLMPPAVGSGSFWTGMVEYMQEGPGALDGILSEIDSSWPAE
jgi:alpha-glucoside transport system substrate-binding protein